jgi:regulator of protease activity HflC (stomatin/prohibitin superfamily)
MEKQIKAERNKRAIILEAEAAKQDMVLRAEGDREARIREAEGIRQAKELEAIGEAIAIESIARAEQKRIQLLKEAGLSEQVLAYQSFEALSEIAKGPANKVFLPTSVVETLGSLGAVSGIFKEKKSE